MSEIKKIMDELSKEVSPKYCKDCKWALKPNFADWLLMGKDHNTRFMKCGNHKLVLSEGKHLVLIDPILSIREQAMFCSVNREFENLCGPQGKHFEPKTKEKK